MTTQISGDTGVSQCQPNSVSQDDLQSGVVGKGPAFSAYLGSTYTPPLNTWAKVPFNTVAYNYNSLFNIPATRMVAPVAGLYLILARITNADSTQKALAVYKNGVLLVTLVNGINANTASGCVLADALAGDYFEIYAYMGSTLGVGIDTTFQSFLVRSL